MKTVLTVFLHILRVRAIAPERTRLDVERCGDGLIGRTFEADVDQLMSAKSSSFGRRSSQSFPDCHVPSRTRATISDAFARL